LTLNCVLTASPGSVTTVTVIATSKRGALSVHGFEVVDLQSEPIFRSGEIRAPDDFPRQVLLGLLK
jgi:hypothetical protein